jgi:hypothetical protein
MCQYSVTVLMQSLGDMQTNPAAGAGYQNLFLQRLILFND